MTETKRTASGTTPPGSGKSEGGGGPRPPGQAVALSVHARLDPKCPEGLGEHGRALWASVAAAPLLLSAPERALFLTACRETDLAEEIAAVVAEEGLMLPWGEGQMRAHPLLSALESHRGLAARLLRTLAVPAEKVPEPGATRGRRGTYRIYATRGGA